MILIYTQNFDSKFKKADYEIVSYGVALAKQMNTSAVALSLGKVADDELKTLAKYGVAKIVAVENDNLNFFDPKVYGDVIAKVAEKYDVKGFVFANNNQGQAIAPRLSARFKAAFVSAVTELPVSVEPLKITKKVYTGKAYSQVQLKTPHFVFTLSQNSFGVHENAVEVSIEKIDVQVSAPSISLIEQKRDTSGKVLLTDAEIVVSGGRGMKSPDNWEPIEELAKLLNAATACSRPVSDEGWRPHTEHVGQTGKIIAPNLYFALGISGAIQHLGGISNSKCIVAVNIDKDAPIFEAADYGMIADVHKVLPELIEEIKKVRH